jgi:hypothetical protein
MYSEFITTKGARSIDIRIHNITKSFIVCQYLFTYIAVSNLIIVRKRNFRMVFKYYNTLCLSMLCFFELQVMLWSYYIVMVCM